MAILAGAQQEHISASWRCHLCLQVLKLTPLQLRNAPEGRQFHCTCAVFSHAGEVLASYSDGVGASSGHNAGQPHPPSPIRQISF